MKTTLLALAATCTALAAAPAVAGNTTIEYADLNLASPQGQKALDRRIDAAVRKHCAYDEQTTGTRFRSKEVETCVAKAKAQVRSQLAAINPDTQLGG